MSYTIDSGLPELNKVSDSLDLKIKEIDRILEIEKTTRHDVIAFLTSVTEKVGIKEFFAEVLPEEKSKKVQELQMEVCYP